jgi:hypothetical protein
MLNRLRRILKKWNSLLDDGDSDSIEYTTDWVKDLLSVLEANRKDKDFSLDIVVSASQFYKKNFDDQQKTDAFVFLLGSYMKKK